MKRLLSVLIVSMASVVVNAQEFGGASNTNGRQTQSPSVNVPVPTPVGQGTGVEQMQQASADDMEPAETAEAAIKNYRQSKGWISDAYDEQNDRIIVSHFIEFQTKNPRVSSAFINQRNEKMAELLLGAKAKIIEGIMSKMSGERILELPGNPIAKQLEKEQEEINAQLTDSFKQLEILDKNMAEASRQCEHLSSNDRLRFIANWFAKADAEKFIAKVDADKQERYKNAKVAFEEAQKAYAGLAGKAETLKGNIAKGMRTSVSRIAQMPIYGCTVLKQAESVKEKNGVYTYQIAILYSWSGEMMRAAGEILAGHSIQFRPGKKSLNEWLASKARSGELSMSCGPRQYIDNKGKMWFLGIACAPVGDDADENESAREIAELNAAVEVMFSLYSDVQSSKIASTLMQSRYFEDGEKKEEFYKDYNKNQKESFKDIQISGNIEQYSGQLRHTPSGLDLRVVVYGVNSGNTKTLKDIQTKAVSLGIEVNTAQEMERGRQEQLQQSFKASKENPAARAAGAAQEKTDLQKGAVRRSTMKQQGTGFKETTSKGQSASSEKGMLRPGVRIINDADE